jgi:hypothetical protein
LADSDIPTPDIAPDLSMLLDPAEINVLHQQGLDPNDYTIVMLGSGSVGVSNKLPDGSYVLQLQVRIPPGLFQPADRRILLPNQPPPSDLDGALGLPPTVRLVCNASRLSEGVRQQIAQQVAQVFVPVEDQ